MKALVINLWSEGARMGFMAGQLIAQGIPFERLEAVTPETVSPPPSDPYWTLWERPLRATEMAAMASHRAAWALVAESDAPMLILEDDAVLHADTAAFLDATGPLEDAELVTLETRGRAKLIARSAHPAARMHRLWQDRSGAAAYILRPSGARKLLARVARAPALADAVLCAAYEVTTWQAVPALACQLDRCEAEGIPLPLASDSAIGREAKPSAAPSPDQKRRRLRSQLRMGLRQAAHLAGSRRLILPYGTIP